MKQARELKHPFRPPCILRGSVQSKRAPATPKASEIEVAPAKHKATASIEKGRLGSFSGCRTAKASRKIQPMRTGGIQATMNLAISICPAFSGEDFNIQKLLP